MCSRAEASKGLVIKNLNRAASSDGPTGPCSALWNFFHKGSTGLLDNSLEHGWESGSSAGDSRLTLQTPAEFNGKCLEPLPLPTSGKATLRVLDVRRGASAPCKASRSCFRKPLFRQSRGTSSYRTTVRQTKDRLKINLFRACCVI